MKKKSLQCVSQSVVTQYFSYNCHSRNLMHVSCSPWNVLYSTMTFDCKTYLSEQPSESLSTPIMFGVRPDNADDVQDFR